MTTDSEIKPERSPAAKFLLVLAVGFILAIPLFSVWLLTSDRQSQSQTAQASIVTGWGGPQVFAGPRIVLPYRARVTETVEDGGKSVTRTNLVTRELVLSPKTLTLSNALTTEVKRRAIYEVAVYDTAIKGKAVFTLPDDFARFGVPLDQIDFARAELRFGLSDARGLSGNNRVAVDGKPVSLQPGKGLNETSGSGFFAWVDAGTLPSTPIAVDFTVRFKGNQSLTVVPHAGQTDWTVTSKWPHPSFVGTFIPVKRTISDAGFTANYDITNLALGTSLVNLDASTVGPVMPDLSGQANMTPPVPGVSATATVNLVQPVDIYDQVSRATKYGFLFIGFTFVAFLMFDLIGGLQISAVQYILIGGGLILFFVLLLAFAEIIGFALAYVVASGAILGLITAYAASALGSWRRAGIIGGLLAALYGAIYILLSLEAYALLIGSLLLFAALAGVMYLTRNLDWSRTLRR